MITRHKRALSVPLLALVALAAGCGTASAPPSGTGTVSSPPSAGAGGHPSGGSTPPGAPTPVPTTTVGPPLLPGQPACTGWPSTAARIPLPASFVPVSVLRCVNKYQTIPGKGQWETATLERADKNLAALTTALRQPSGHRAPGVMCPEIAMLPPQIVLVDGSGKMIIPRLPLSGCGLVQTQVLAALNQLPWQTVSVRLIAQVQPPPQAASGSCTSGFKDPFLVYGSAAPSRGGAVYVTIPTALRICVYETGGSANSSQFLRGTTVTGATVSALLADLSGPRTTGLCGLPHAQFAVVEGENPGDAVVYVELGGCYRVLRYSPGTGGLMSITTGQATPQAIAIINTVTHHPMGTGSGAGSGLTGGGAGLGS